MRIVFLGSPESVLEPLKFLHKLSDHQLVGVVSQPAKKAGRGKKLLDPAVAVFAKEQNIPCFQPVKASDSDFLEQMRELKPDVMVTAAYGQILTDSFLEVPTRATINIHPSMLPKYRGAIPVPAAIMAGDETTGVSILFTVKKLDAGNIIVQKQFDILATETSDELTRRMFEKSVDLLSKSLTLLTDSKFIGSPQDESLVTHCKKITKEQGLVDWSRTSSDLLNHFRALSPWPGSYTFYQNKRIAVESVAEVKKEEYQENSHALNLLDGLLQQQPGSFQYLKSKKEILARTSDGLVKITQFKPAGSKSQDAPSFWNGLKDKERLLFEQQ